MAPSATVPGRVEARGVKGAARARVARGGCRGEKVWEERGAGERGISNSTLPLPSLEKVSLRWRGDGRACSGEIVQPRVNMTGAKAISIKPLP